MRAIARDRFYCKQKLYAYCKLHHVTLYMSVITALLRRFKAVVELSESFQGGLMAIAEREPIMGVWGRCPQRGPGAEPWSGGQGGEAPLKLKAFYSSAAPN